MKKSSIFSRFISFTLVFVLILSIASNVVESVDQNKFRTCKDSHFCWRNIRDRKDSPMSGEGVHQKHYELLQGSIRLEKGVLHGDIVADGNKEETLSLLMNAVKDGILHFKVTEKTPLPGKKRYEVQDVILPSAELDSSLQFLEKPSQGKNEFSIQFGEKKSTARVTLNPFRVDLYVNGELAISTNEKELMHFEHMKLKPSAPQPLPKPEDENNTEANAGQAEKDHEEALEGYWQERFSSHHDSKPNGPMSIGMDFTFVNSRHVYGIPEHASSFALKNTKGEGINTDPYRLYNLDVFEFELDKTMALYGSIPLMISHRAGLTCGVFWLNAAETFIDIEDSADQKSRHTHWISESGAMEVYLLTGPTVSDLFAQYATLTGTTALPQMFALGYHQSRWNYKSEDDVAQVDKGFDEHGIPYDVLWLDIEHTDGKRYFTWDKSQFPTPERMMKSLDEKNRKIVTIVDPHIKKDDNYYIYSEANSKGYYIKNKDRNDFNGWCWPGSSAYLDFTNPVIRDWWASQFAYDKYKGSAPNTYIWNDMNEPSVFDGPEVSMPKDNIHFGDFEHRDVHNLYGYYYHMATAQGLVKRNPDHNDRPFVLSRAFFAGTQRIGAIWTGDNTAKWEHLASSNPMLLAINIAGISFSGADVGGFFGNPDAQLVTRWYQTGAFQPFFRGHAHLDSRRREPWLFGEPYLSVIRSAIAQRYSYLPYWYTTFFQNTQSGLPVMRPLWVEFPNDASLFAVEDQYMIGNALLVKPVTQENQASVDVILPGGDSQYWYETDTEKRFTGTPSLKVDTPLEKIPVFQRGGTIIPKKERLRRSASLMRDDPYTLRISLDSQGKAHGELYVDDEHSFNYQTKKQYLYKSFQFEKSQLKFTSVSSNKYETNNYIERIVILGIESKPNQVVLDDQKSLDFEFDKSTRKLTIRNPKLSITSDWTVNIK